MSEAFRCDVCGAFFEDLERKKLSFRTKKMSIRPHLSFWDASDSDTIIHLCPGCEKKALKEMLGKG